MKNITHLKSISGTSLIELLLASALGLVLMAGLATYQYDIFILSDEITSDLQQDFAHARSLSILEESVNTAGFIPTNYIVAGAK